MKSEYRGIFNWKIYWLCALGVLALILWGCTSPVVSSSADHFQMVEFHEGWSQQFGDSQIPLDNIQDYTPVGVGESLVFTCTLPVVREGGVLIFYSSNEEVCCYVDGELIQNFTMQEGFEILETPGSAWNQIDLDSSMTGKTCTLIFHSPTGQYDYLCDIYFVDNQYVDTVRMHYFWQVGLAAFGICLIMLITTLVGLVVRQPRRRRYLLAIAQYFFIMVLWLLAELNFYDLFFGRPIISYLLGEVFKRMIPLALLHLAKNSTNQYWHPGRYKVVTALAWGNLLVPLALQFTVGISLIETAAMHYLIVSVVNITLLCNIGEKMLYFKKLGYEDYPCLAVPILVVSSGVDNALLYFNSVYHPFVGVWTAIGGLIFSIFTLAILTHVNSRIAQDKLEVERSCELLENNALVKQIEAHFIFNVLNTVSAYCKTDPEEADRAVNAFAKYLRAYLHLVTQHENIPIDKELELVRQYLILQQLRFGTELRFTFDVAYRDFSIPPFLLHTFVENAVIHGLRIPGEGGCISLSTRQVGEMIEAVVADTGVGYDTSLPVKETSVGLHNAERRLKLMRNGTITIESIIGEGTKVTLLMPVDEIDET